MFHTGLQHRQDDKCSYMAALHQKYFHYICHHSHKDYQNKDDLLMYKHNNIIQPIICILCLSFIIVIRNIDDVIQLLKLLDISTKYIHQAIPGGGSVSVIVPTANGKCS